MRIVRRLVTWLLAISMILGSLVTDTVTAYAAADRIDLSKYVTNATLTMKDGSALPEELPYGSEVTLNMAWLLPNADDDGNPVETSKTNLSTSTVFEYTLPIKFTNKTSLPLYNGATEVGTYTIWGNKLTFTYNEKFLSSGENNISGTLALDAVIDDKNGGGSTDNPYSWSFPGTDTTYTGTIKRNSKDDGLKIEKSINNTNDSVNSLTGHEVTIKITSTGSNDSVTVSDALGEYLTNVQNIQIKDANGNTVEGATSDGSGQNYTFSLGNMSNGDVYYITYTVDAKADGLWNNNYNSWTGGEGYKNKASVEDSKKKHTSDAEVKLSKQWLSKTGTLNAETGNIDWTITVNVSGATVDLNGYVLKDVIGANQTLVEGTFSSNISGLTYDALTGDGYTFGENSTGNYNITYSTKPSKTQLGQQKYTNEATLTPTDGKTISSGSQEIGIGSDTSITKSCETGLPTYNNGRYGSSNEVTWKSTVTVPANYGKIEDATFTDGLQGNSMELVSVRLGENDITSDVTTTSNGGFTYTWTIENSEEEQTFTFTYVTRITYPDTADQTWYNNTATFNGGSATATYQYKAAQAAPAATKYLTEGDWGDSGIAKWHVSMSDISALEGKNSTDNRLILQDTLPSGLAYVDGSAYISVYSGDKGWQNKKIVPTQDEQVLSFDVSEYISYFQDATGNNTWRMPSIEYKTKVTGAVRLETGKIYEYKNSAQWSLDGQTVDPVKATYHYKNSAGKLLSKSAKYSEDTAPNAEYTVKVNPKALDLYPDAATYSLTDTTGKALDYYQGSLQYSTDGGKTYATWTDVSYDKTSRTLTIKNIQDETSYTFKYKCTVNLATGEEFSNDPNSDHYAGNSISFAGEGVKSTSSSAALSGAALKSRGTSTKEGKSIRVYKYEEGSYEKGLAGVKFETVAQKNITDKQVDTTDEAGYVTFDGLSYDTIYVLTEQQTITGYTLDSKGYYFCFDGNNPITDKTMPDGSELRHIGQSEGLITLDISNRKSDEETTQVEISKVDATSKSELPGAELTITDKDGKTVESWTSTESTHKVTLAAGTYTMTETTAPKGYTKAESITFVVTEEGKVTVNDTEVEKVVMEDCAVENGKVKISKTDIGGSTEIAGAKLTITDNESKEVDSWTSVAGKTHEVALADGTYTLTETTAPDGYEKAEDITFTVTNNVDGTVTVTVGKENVSKVVMKDDYSKQTVKISKTDITGKKEIGGAVLSITDSEGNAVDGVDSWTSVEGETHEISVLPGTYILTETTAPEGYKKAESITFTVDKDGVIKVGNETVNKVTMKDAADNGKVYISKTDMAGSKELGGAQLTITDAAGNTVDSWTSVEGKTHASTLEAGTYTLTETTAPDGYEVAESITFVVRIVDGKVQITVDGQSVDKVVMKDEYSYQTVKISKTNINGTEEIAGALLKVTDQDGNRVDSWTSQKGETHEISVQPGTYTLTEITAPKGYKQAESITFTVDEKGIITVDGQTVNKVTMKDAADNGKVVISKTDINGTKEIAGAELVIKDKEGNEVDSWTSEADKSHEVTLKEGTYTLTETTAPNGYVKAEDITFTVEIGDDDEVIVKQDGEEVNKVVMKDDYSEQKVTISKTDINGTKEIAGAKLEVQDKDRKTVESWTSEAGKSHEVNLKPGTYTLVETTAPDGYKKAESIEFTVDETGKVVVGNDTVEKVVMKDAADNGMVLISKTDINGTKEIGGAQLTITNQAGETIDYWTSEEGKTHEVDLKEGTYTLTEITAPNGYKKAESITFTVAVENDEVIVKVNGEEVDMVVMKDDYADRQVEISKTDINGTNEIEGAVLEVQDKNSQTVASWTSEAGKSHKITVKPGTYTLVETTAPNGYEVAEKITFVVGIDGKVKVGDNTVTKVVMKDAYKEREVSISKQNIANAKEIAGARLTITGEDGLYTHSWTSSADGAEVIKHAWVHDAVYTLTEVSSPSGFDRLTTNITFSVDENGKVTVQSTGEKNGKAEGVVAEDGTLVVNNTASKKATPTEEEHHKHHHDDDEDTPTTTVVTNIEESGSTGGSSVAMVKTDARTGLAVAGATYNLYTIDGVLVGTYVTDSYGIIRVDGLAEGGYYFLEQVAPEGYSLDSWQQFFTLTYLDTAEQPQIVAVSDMPIEDGAGIGVESGAGIGTEVGGATGDDSNMVLYMVMMAMAAAALAAWEIKRRVAVK